jgi:hypothetical protein
MWALRDVQGAAYYTRTHSDGDAAAGAAGAGAEAEATQVWTTTIAYNAKTGKAYVVSARKQAGK